MIQTDVLIVGGGLAGLRLADLLVQAGRDVHLIEARTRFGGRILSQSINGAGFDLGPAWFWQGQPRIAALTTRFNLPVFEQYAQGAFRFEDAHGRIQQGSGYGSMAGSLRIDGGLTRLTDALAETLPRDQRHLGARMTEAKRDGISLIVRCENGQAFQARHLVFALPPRLVPAMRFTPALPDAAMQAMSTVPTWMAGQAKVVAVYDTPFWRDEGLSGDAMSQRGPLVEIHDASPRSEGPYALFGFVGVPPDARRDQTALKAAAVEQLTRLFGAQAATPRDVILQDWALEADTATQADQAPLTQHPSYGMPPALETLWDRHLHFAGSEVGKTFGGYLEGALEAAEQAFSRLHGPA